eukprot:5890637-Amphidinium_carterae.2
MSLGGEPESSPIDNFGRLCSRDLLPLPFVGDSPLKLKGGRRAQQRADRKRAKVEACNDIVSALNTLAGVGSFTHVFPSKAQQASLTRIQSAVELYELGTETLAPEAALSELLSTRASEYDSGGSTSVVDMSLELLSLPEQAGVIPLENVLPLQERDRLLSGAGLFHSPSEFHARQQREGKAKSYLDPQLREQGAFYVQFVHKLQERRMLTFRRKVSSCVGAFTVLKKSGRQRLIIDARVANQMMVRPPKTCLSSSAVMSEYMCAGTDEHYFSGQDIADCYYQFRLPEHLTQYLALPRVRAAEVGVTETVEGRVGPNDWVWPCFCVLPMGFAWALHWVQVGHRELISRCGLCTCPGAPPEWTDRQPPVRPLPGEPAMLLYVDNQLFVAKNSWDSGKALDRAHSYFTSLGLPLHEVEKDVRLIDFLGLELDGVHNLVRIGARKRMRLKRAWEQIRRKPMLSGQELEVIIGHLTHVLLLNRPLLATFGACYSYIRRFYRSRRTLWPSVYAELKIAFSLLPLATIHWDWNWHDTVVCADASTKGYGVHEMKWSPEELERVGAWSD